MVRAPGWQRLDPIPSTSAHSGRSSPGQSEAYRLAFGRSAQLASRARLTGLLLSCYCLACCADMRAHVACSP
eukprot:3280117-Prymnesium_polylepis.1